MRASPMPLTVFLLLCCCAGRAQEHDVSRPFDSAKDLISLHYDHAPDKDDGHSAAADRTLLESLYGAEWLVKHVVPVSGAYGKNKNSFNLRSDAVMDAAWNDAGGWIAADKDWEAAVANLVTRWDSVLKAGGDVWVKEGGQSDITAAVVERIKKTLPSVDSTKRIHVVQHGRWNEQQTTETALAYTKKHTHYVKIPNANSFLNKPGGDDTFVRSARSHATFGAAWEAAFDYYDPKTRLDFSDTGELMHILGLGRISFDEFRKRFLEDE